MDKEREKDIQIKVTETEKVSESIDTFPDLGERFQIHALIGEGAMGSVYKATDLELDKIVAVKLLKPELARDSVAVKRFEQEVEAASKLNNANLVSIYCHGQTTEQLPYLSMDYIEGGNLSDYIKKHGKLREKTALDLAIQICEALDHAHSNRIIHRDLKPSNILIKRSEDGLEQFKVADFGIAKVITGTAGETGALTGTGDILGSPLYMSPEQCQGEELDERSDIYSLACMLVEVLTGKPPYEGANSVKIILAHLNEPVEKVAKNLTASGISRTFSDVIIACLNKSKDGRYKNIKDLAQDLRLIKGKAQPVNLGTLKQGGKNMAAWILAVSLAFFLSGLLMAALVITNSHKSNQNPVIFQSINSGKPALKDMKSSRITDEDLKNASDMDKLESNLELKYSRVTDQGLSYLSGFGGLQRLNLSSTDITDQGLKNISNLRNLRTLTLNRTKITDEGIRELTKIYGLERLYLSNTHITDRSMPYLAKFNRLKTLCLRETRVTDNGLKFLQDSNIKTLHLVQTRVTDKGLASLAKIKTLQSLQLKKSAITGDGLAYLSQLPNLDYLSLQSTDVDDSHIKALTGLKSLRSLRLTSTKITDQAIVYLSQMKNLRYLYLGSTEITDKNIYQLSNLKSLTYLNLTHTKITDRALESISKFPTLRTLYLSNTKVTDRGILSLAKAPKLTSVFLKGCDQVSPDGMKKLKELKQNLRIE